MKSLIFIFFLIFFSCYHFVHTNESMFVKEIEGYVDEPNLPIYLRKSLENNLLIYGYSLANSPESADLVIELKILRYELDNLGYKRQDNSNGQKESSDSTYRAINSRINLYADYLLYKKGEIISKGRVFGSGDFYEYADLKIERSKAFRVASEKLSKSLVSRLLVSKFKKEK